MLEKPLVVAFAPPQKLTEKLETFARGIIGPEDRRRFGKWEERKIAYFAGRAALRLALEEAGLEGIVTPDGEYGYLKIECGTPVFGNISHTRGLVAAVICKHPVGIDVESSQRDASQVMKRVATAQERAEWKSPIQLWSAKEALSKAFGLGMRFGLQSFEARWSKELPWKGIAQVKGPLDVKEPAIWQEDKHGFLISVATEIQAIQKGVALLLGSTSRALEERIEMWSVPRWP